MLNFNLLGNFQITLDEKPLKSFPARSGEALLIYLAYQTEPVSRERLAEMLWHDRTTKQALSNLRSILSSVRKQVGEHLITTRQTLFLDDRYVDAQAFEQQAQSAETLPAMEAAIALYRGEFLSGFHLREAHGFESWLLLERERLRVLAADLLQRLAHSDCDPRDGLRYAQMRVDLDPFSEEARRRLMWLLTRNGRRNKALQQFQQLRDLLADELGVPPTPATMELYQQLRELTLPPTYRLPTSARPLIGRSAEIDQLQAHLFSSSLVTVTGIGGTGKTRLALATAQKIATESPNRFLSGGAFVSLVSIDAASELPFAIAEGIGLQLRPVGSAEKQLINLLQKRELLLILDNFEPLLVDDAAVGFVERLLDQLPDLTLLITSRERLRLTHETVFDIGGLAVPPEDAPDPLAYDAVQLFIARARQVQRQFVPDGAQIAAICRLAEGTPLAIELAAQWVRVYALDEIVAQMQEAIHFLATRQRNVPARHRSIRAVFASSWSLLDADEQAAFARLAVFPADFDIAAAQAVSQASPDLIAALHDKSLLRSSAESRLSIHPLLRDFAADHLTERTAIETRFATYYLKLLIAQHDPLANALDRHFAIREAANIRASWQIAVRQQMWALVQQAAMPVYLFFWYRNRFREGIALLSLGIADAPLAVQAALRIRRARLAIYEGRLDSAEKDVQFALTHADAVATMEVALAHSYLGIIHIQRGEYAAAEQAAMASLALAQQSDVRGLAAFANNILATCYKRRGDYQAAWETNLHSLAQYQQVNDEMMIATMHNNIGNIAQIMGNFATARDHYRASRELFQRIDQPYSIAVTASNAGRLAGLAGDYAEARELLNEALTTHRQQRNERGIASTQINLTLVALAKGELRESAERLQDALQRAEAIDAELLVVEIIVLAAQLLHRHGESVGDLLCVVWQHEGISQEVREMAQKVADDIGLTLDGCTEIALASAVEKVRTGLRRYR